MTDEAETTTTTETDTTPIDGASDEAMLAALRAARDAEPKADGQTSEEDPPAAPEGISAPAEGETKPPADAAEEDETELARLRKERAKIEREQQARDAMKAQLRAELEAELRGALPKRDDLLAEARKEWLARFRQDPVAAFRDADVDGAQAVARLADAASPEGKLHARIAELESRLEKAHDPLAKRLEQIEAERKAEREQYMALVRAQEERALVQQIDAAADAAPAVRAYFESESKLVSRAREIAAEYTRMTSRETCPWSVIVQELKSEARREAPKEIERLQKRLAELTKLVQKPAPAAADKKPAEPRGAAIGTRTLTAKSGSERRSTPKPLAEMSDDEREAAALEAAREAMRGTKRGTKTVSG